MEGVYDKSKVFQGYLSKIPKHGKLWGWNQKLIVLISLTIRTANVRNVTTLERSSRASSAQQWRPSCCFLRRILSLFPVMVECLILFFLAIFWFGFNSIYISIIEVWDSNLAALIAHLVNFFLVCKGLLLDYIRFELLLSDSRVNRWGRWWLFWNSIFTCFGWTKAEIFPRFVCHILWISFSFDFFFY